VLASLFVLAVTLTQQSGATTRETITVTAHPAPLADTPEDVVVITKDALNTTAAPAIDDTLRQIPGFTLFRRSGSRVANPTSQGVSLRGIGASGASRALVLDDGIPLNDPFGGWVYWGRVPQGALDRVEVMRGGASDIYGSAAVGGVISFVRRASGGVRIDASAGSESTRTTSLYAAMERGVWSGIVAADFFDSDGYVLVDRPQRGAVDVEAASRHTAFDATLRHTNGFLRASSYSESRQNGTPLQINDTRLEQLAAGYNSAIDSTPFDVRAYLLEQRYHQTFSAIATNRASERLTTDQRVPSRGSGASVSIVPRSFVIGAEVRSVSGASNELNFAANGAVTSSRVDGHQRSLAAHAADFISLRSLTLNAGIRYDAWRNDDASRNGVALANRKEGSWSPRLTALLQATPSLSFSASAYRAFRAPTLNELYRSFRVGNVLTLANETLGAERLTGFELGARTRNLRVTLFSMDLDDTVANVTLTSTPSLITRQRQNLGSSRSRGAEVEWSETLRMMRVTAGYLFSDAKLSTGKRTPQVPRHQATMQLAHANAGVQVRWTSSQFDDDLNQFQLRSALVADLFASHRIASNFDVTFAIENLFNRRVEAAATPVISLGQPRAVRVGIRYAR
jgi:outer membrane receptor protein involved in Fe transport